MKKLFGVIVTLAFATAAQAGDIAKGKASSATCAACHGADGNSPVAMYPKLAGQNEKYLVKQIKDFKSGDRKNDVMAPMAAMLTTDEDIDNVAAYFASQSVQHMAVEDKYIALGERLYRSGDADRNIPACTACHGPTGVGMPAAGFPSLGGQHADYVKAQLVAFRDGSRSNDANSVMRNVVAKMSDEQIEALAHYVVGLH